MSKMLDAVEAVHGGSSTEPGSREPKIKRLMVELRYDNVGVLLPIVTVEFRIIAAVNKKTMVVAVALVISL